MKAKIKQRVHYSLMSAVAGIGLISNAAHADDFFKDGDFSLFLRYRLELVDQDNLPRNATASTLQSLWAFKSGNVGGFQGFFELRNVQNIGAENYNNTFNGNTQFPVVADPEATEIDQAYLSFGDAKNTIVTVGRQKLVWGNKRFVSKLVWRQNHRSFDGATIESRINDQLDFKYTYAFNVNRAFTDNSPIGNFDANVHLANVNYDVGNIGKLTAYGYWLDMNDAFAVALSTRTLGANFTGSRPLGHGVKLGYTIEAAHQKDQTNNPFEIGVGYFRAEPSLKAGNFNVRAGYEVLGGNGTRGFQTPFALLHAYNGWADQFLTTPGAGLRDAYAEVQYNAPKGTALAGTNVILAYHDFDSDLGNIQYGTEWNVSISKKLFGRFTALLKYAAYNADSFASNTNKFWFQLVTKF